MIYKYTCPCCGGKIDIRTMTCEYCGTQYRREWDYMVRVEHITNPVRTYEAKSIIPSIDAKAIGPENMARISMQRIQGEIAAELYNVMKYDVDFEPSINAYVVRGQVRVVVPKDNGISQISERMRR